MCYSKKRLKKGYSMKNLLKKRAFMGLITLFTLNLVASSCFAMEEETSQPQRKSPLSLTQLAADAYIEGFKKDDTFNEISAMEIKQELSEKYPCTVSEIQEIINQRLSQDNVCTEQYLDEKVVAILPDSNQIATQESNNISFWKVYSSNNTGKNGLLAGMVGCMPGAGQNIAQQLNSKKDTWQKAFTLKLPENFKVKYVNENIILCNIIHESENDDEFFEIKKIAIFVKSKNGFKMKQIIEMKNSIADCAFLSDEKLLALALDNNSIVLFRHNKLSKTWQQAETIENATSKEFHINKIAFLHQAYKENPLIFIHSVQTPEFDVDVEAMSFIQFDKNTWQNSTNILNSNYIKIFKSHDSKMITVQYLDQDSPMTMLIEECNNRDQLYTSKNFIHFRDFSFDRKLSIHQEQNETLNISELATGNTVKSIEGHYYHQPIFISNNSVAIVWGNGTKILSLRQAIDFALCAKVLAESEKKKNVDLNAFIQSPLINQLSYQEKKLVTQKAQKILSSQSFKGKINHLRWQCRLWSYNNPNLYQVSMIATGLGIYLTSIYIHSKIDPNLSYWSSFFNSKIKAGLCAGSMHGIIVLGLTNKLSNFLFPM